MLEKTWWDFLISEVEAGNAITGRLNQLLEEELRLVAGLEEQLVVLIPKHLIARPRLADIPDKHISRRNELPLP